MRSIDRKPEAGFALLAVVAVVGTLLLGAAATIRLAKSELRYVADDVSDQAAFYVAEAGVHRSIAQLEQDRATASVDGAYAWSLSDAAFGLGTYSASIGQDPLYPSDPRRKLVQSTGAVRGETSTVSARVLVQADTTCPILFSDTARARLVTTVAGATNLVDGEIFSNEDAEINLLVGISPKIDGTISAVDDFYETGEVSLLSNVDAELYYGDRFHFAPLHQHLLFVNTGLHFDNGAGGHGQKMAVASRPFPVPDFDRLRHHAGVVVVNEDNVPHGSWNSTTGTWTYNGLLNPPADQTIVYFVEGNARLQSLRILRDSSVAVVATGWIVLQELSIVNTGLLNLDVDEQNLILIARDDVIVGRQIVSESPLTLQGEGLTGALAPTETTGLGIATVETFDRNRVYGYSENGQVWVKASSLAATSQTRACLIARQNATFATMASILSTVEEVD